MDNEIIETKNEQEIEFLTPMDVAKLMGCSIPTARKLFYRDDFPSLRIGKNLKVLKSSFIEWCSTKKEWYKIICKLQFIMLLWFKMKGMIIISIFEHVKNILLSLTTEQITLFSVLVTIIIFIAGQRSQNKYKKLESRRTEYKKFINILQKIYSGNFKMTDKTKTEFFDTGVSLLIYGSKKVYKKYIFFREFSTNPLIIGSKYNDKNTIIYIMADILKTIRHEVGMTNFGELEDNVVLSFFINDLGTNPLSKNQSYKARYNIFMIKTELFFVNRLQFTFTKKVFYKFIKPVFGFISLTFKYLFMIPLGKFLKKKFPSKFDSSSNKDNDGNKNNN